MPKPAGEFIYDIKQAIAKKPVNDVRIADYAILKEFGWSQRELNETPAYKVMAYRLIMSKSAAAQKK
jgi:hypothetical protein